MQFLYSFIKRDIIENLFINQKHYSCYLDKELNGEAEIRIFSSELKKQLKNHDLEIWPGFRLGIRCFENIPMLTIDLDHLIVRFESGLSFINEVKKEMPVSSKLD